MVAILLLLLVNAVIPLTASGGWRGLADVTAVLFYLPCIPFAGITLVELGIIGTGAGRAVKLHAIFIAIFLVVADVAKIFGMLDPTLLGYEMHH